jgi:multidrug transporter EmrE-like cation transporter
MADLSGGAATTFARAATQWTPLDWWKLEARALHRVPELRRSLAAFAPTAAWKDLAKNVAPAWGCLLTLSNIASFTLPVIALLFLLSWIFGRNDVAPVGVAGLLAGVAALIAGIGIATELRESLGTDPKIHRMLGSLHLVPSAIGLLIAVGAIAQGAADGVWGVVGLLADVIVGILHFLMFRGPAHTGSDRWQRSFSRLEAALDGMPPDERMRIYSDIQTALADLSDRGLISLEDFARARELRIGILGMTMAPREDLTPR